MHLSMNCPTCQQLVRIDFQSDDTSDDTSNLTGVMPPHGSKNTDGVRSCGKIGQMVSFESPEDARVRRMTAAVAATAKLDEDRRKRREEMEAAEAAEREYPTLGRHLRRQPEMALLATVLGLTGYGLPGTPRSNGSGGPGRWRKGRWG